MSPNPSKTLFYLHIPKNAGKTMKKIVTRQYRPEEMFQINTVDEVEKLRELTADRKGQLKLIYGNRARYDLDEIMSQNKQHFIIFREPVERVLSFYFYAKRDSTHRLHRYVALDKMTIEDFVSSGVTYQGNNGQVRLLVTEGEQVPIGSCPTEFLNEAKHNILNTDTIVGLTKHFDTSLLMGKYAYGWGNIAYTKQNVTKGRPQQDDFSQETLDYIRRYNELDIQLYDFVCELYKKQEMALGSSLARDMRFLSMKNTFYGRVSSIKVRLAEYRTKLKRTRA